MVVFASFAADDDFDFDFDFDDIVLRVSVGVRSYRREMWLRARLAGELPLAEVRGELGRVVVTLVLTLRHGGVN